MIKTTIRIVYYISYIVYFLLYLQYILFQCRYRYFKIYVKLQPWNFYNHFYNLVTPLTESFFTPIYCANTFVSLQISFYRFDYYYPFLNSKTHFYRKKKLTNFSRIALIEIRVYYTCAWYLCAMKVEKFMVIGVMNFDSQIQPVALI